MAAKKKKPVKAKASKSSKSSSSKAKGKARSGSGASKAKGKGAKRGGKRAPRTSRRPSPRPKKVKKVQKPKAPAAEAPAALALAKTIATVAQDKKASDILIIDMREKAASVGYDYIVIASADSDRQLTSLQDAVEEELKKDKRRSLGVETSPDWVLLDFDDVIVHFFTPEKRELVDLEGNWRDAPHIAFA